MDEDSRQFSSLAELILEQTADAVIYSNRQGVIERWNKAATVLFGYEWMEANGQSLDLIIPESLRAAHWRGFEAAVTQGATRLHGRPTLTRAEHKSGTRLYVEMSFSLVTDELGNVLGSVAMAVAAAPSGGVVAIVEGSYTKATGNVFTIGPGNKALTLVAPVGTVVIGN